MKTKTTKTTRHPLPRVEILARRGGKFGFHKVNRNGEITQPSQGYASRQGARRAARRDCPGVPLVTR